MTLASILIEAGRAGRRARRRRAVPRLRVSDQELREDISVLNVVNFGAGTYVLYAEIGADGMIEVDPEPYGDSFARPARLLPVEAKALIAAIDLIGEHIPRGLAGLGAREGRGRAGRGPRPRGPADGRRPAATTPRSPRSSRARSPSGQLLSFEYYKENEDEFSHADGRALRADQRPRGLVRGRASIPSRESVRHFRLDRIKSATVTDERFEPRPDVDPAADVDGWPRTGEVPASRRARVWISPERARWAREERTVVAELEDGAVIVELGFAGVDWLVREVLKEAGDAVVLEPEDARGAVRAAPRPPAPRPSSSPAERAT